MSRMGILSPCSRWASIGNMIQFTNTVFGTDVGNWVAGSDMLAFSRYSVKLRSKTQ